MPHNTPAIGTIRSGAVLKKRKKRKKTKRKSPK